MKKIFKCIIGILLFSLLALPFQEEVKAETANSSIGFSSNNIKLGEEVTVTVNFSSSDEMLGGNVYLNYNKDLLEITSGTGSDGVAIALDFYQGEAVSTIRATFKFKAIATGSAKFTIDTSNTMIEGKISAEGWIVNGASATLEIGSSTNPNLSSDNTLSSLVVSAVDAAGKATTVTLSPAFSPANTTYTCKVGKNIVKLSVAATPNDSGAKTAVRWANLDPGENKTYVDVTAANGSVKSYLISTTVTDAATTEPEDETTATEGIKVDVSGKSMTIINDFTGIELPEGFAETSLSYKGQEIKALKDSASGINLVCLSADGEKLFYVYDETNDTFYKYQTITTQGLKYTILKPDDTVAATVPPGFSPMDISIEGQSIEGWIYDEDTNFCLVYAMNTNGEKNLYLYDISENTIQRLISGLFLSGEDTNDASEKLKEVQDEFSKTKLVGLIILGALVVICIVLAVALGSVLRKKSGNTDLDAEDDFTDEFDDDLEDEMEEQLGEKKENTEEDTKKKKYKEPKTEELTDEEMEFIKRLREENEDGEFFEAEIDFNISEDEPEIILAENEIEELDLEISESTKKIEETLNIKDKTDKPKKDFDYFDLEEDNGM